MSKFSKTLNEGTLDKRMQEEGLLGTVSGEISFEDMSEERKQAYLKFLERTNKNLKGQ